MPEMHCQKVIMQQLDYLKFFFFSEYFAKTGINDHMEGFCKAISRLW